MVSMYRSSGTQAYGVIVDVSCSGAQVITGAQFDSGPVLLRIGFDPEAPFATPAEIVWVRDDSDEKHKSSWVYGVRFCFTDDEQKARLLAIIDRPDFEQPVIPGQSPQRSGLDQMMNDLGEELGALGEHMRDNK